MTETSPAVRAEETTREVSEKVALDRARNYLLLFWTSRFGEPAAWVKKRVTSCQDVSQLEALMAETARAATAEEAEGQVKTRLGNGR